MCGEKLYRLCKGRSDEGSPPHVRGKGTDSQKVHHSTGITPACAGKRSKRMVVTTVTRDHPRMCGEKTISGVSIVSTKGSPPHVRGKVLREYDSAVFHGITPACAGKSNSLGYNLTKTEDHPRMCGEK